MQIKRQAVNQSRGSPDPEAAKPETSPEEEDRGLVLKCGRGLEREEGQGASQQGKRAGARQAGKTHAWGTVLQSVLKASPEMSRRGAVWRPGWK